MVHSFTNSSLELYYFSLSISLSFAVFVCVSLVPERGEHRRMWCSQSQTMCDNITAGWANTTESSANLGQKSSLRERLHLFSVGVKRGICRTFGWQRYAEKPKNPAWNEQCIVQVHPSARPLKSVTGFNGVAEWCACSGECHSPWVNSKAGYHNYSHYPAHRFLAWQLKVNLS